jgi:hypothetical protein
VLRRMVGRRGEAWGRRVGGVSWGGGEGVDWMSGEERWSWIRKRVIVRLDGRFWPSTMKGRRLRSGIWRWRAMMG